MLKVGIVLYPGVYLLDFCGPLEVFFDARDGTDNPVFDVFTVGFSIEPVTSHTGLSFIPDFSFQEAPEPNILVIPGGDLELTSGYPALCQWILKSSQKADITLSVCTGVFILADLGLLNGLTATTWFGALPHLKKRYPAIKVASNCRWTDNGHIITTAGISAGIDGALRVISKLISPDCARRTAQFIEYPYHESDFNA